MVLGHLWEPENEGNTERDIVRIESWAEKPGTTPPSRGNDTINVVCTNSVLADFTYQLLKERASVEYIMPAGACPSHFDTRPSDVTRIEDADIVVSLGWEPWLSDLIESSGNTDAVQVKCMGLGEWGPPSGAKGYVDKLAQELSQILPEQNTTIQQNAQEYNNAIDQKAQELLNLMTAKGYTGTNVIVMEWQKPFVEWLGFNVVASYGPPEGLSTGDVLNISSTAQDAEDLALIIDNLQSGTDFGARLASETGAIHIIVTNFPGAVPGTNSYLEALDYNSNQLMDGVSSYEYKKGDIAELEDEVEALKLQRAILGATSGIFAVLSAVLLVVYKKQGETAGGKKEGDKQTNDEYMNKERGS